MKSETKIKTRIPLTSFVTKRFSLSIKPLAVTRTMQSYPAGKQPNSGLAKSRPNCRTRVLGGSALGSGTRVALTNVGSCVGSDDGVARVQALQANVSLYGIACGGGLIGSLGFCSNGNNRAWHHAITGLLAATGSLAAPVQ